jgi:hypothetical protein
VSTANLVELSNVVSLIQAKLDKILPLSTSSAAVGKGNRFVEKDSVQYEPGSPSFLPTGSNNTSSHRRKRRTRSLLAPSPERKQTRKASHAPI